MLTAGWEWPGFGINQCGWCGKGTSRVVNRWKDSGNDRSLSHSVGYVQYWRFGFAEVLPHCRFSPIILEILSKGISILLCGVGKFLIV